MPAAPHPALRRPAHVHEFEPQLGLPERLPPGEHVLWQGTPRWTLLARRVFHIRWAMAWFALMLGWLFADTWQAQGDAWAALRALRWFGPLALLALGLLALLAWMTARTTVYTLTDRRVVMRIGIVLTVAYNLPLRCIDAADLGAVEADGSGDLALTLEPRTRIAWLHLWPHVRPWQVRHTRPMLRAVPDVAQVAAQLRSAWSAANGGAAAAAPLAAALQAAQPAWAAGH